MAFLGRIALASGRNREATAGRPCGNARLGSGGFYFFLEGEGCGADLDLVAGAEADSAYGFAVDEGGRAEGEIFEIEAAWDNVNGGVAAAYGGIFEKVNVAIGRGADVGCGAVENELLAGDEACDDFDPAGLGGIFDETRGSAGDEADGDKGDASGDHFVAGEIGDGSEECAAESATDKAAD